MAFDIKQQAPVERPIIKSGRGASSNFPALVEEVGLLVAEALRLPPDKALPVVVPTEQATDLVRALRAAGELETVTVRFKRFPRVDLNGEPMYTVPKDENPEMAKPITDPFEYTSKNRQNVRVTFWTGKKVERKSTPQIDHDIRTDEPVSAN